jgi:hypothetical protein
MNPHSGTEIQTYTNEDPMVSGVQNFTKNRPMEKKITIMFSRTRNGNVIVYPFIRGIYSRKDGKNSVLCVLENTICSRSLMINRCVML